MKNSYTDQEFIEAVKNSRSKAEALRKLGLKPAGANYDGFNKTAKRLGVDTSHFTGQGWNVGERYRPIQQKKPLKEILVEHSTWTSTNHLRERLLSEGIKAKKCECCGRDTWMDKPIALELHHINGVKDDLRIENLQILCPNCHAFTDNYRGKGVSTSNRNDDVNAG